MGKKTRSVRKKMIVALLTVAMIIPTGIGNQTQVSAAVQTADNPPVLSTAGYRYMIVGESFDFNIRNKIAGSTYTWKSSDTKLAAVNKVGLVKAKKAGTVTISCDIKTKDKSKTYQLKAVVYIKDKVKAAADGVRINNKVDTIVIGERYNLNKDYEPKNSSDNVNWRSSNTNIATVDKNGFVQGVSLGKATITVSTLGKGKEDSVTIQVVDIVTVTDQASLEKALKTTKASNIRIKTDDAKSFRIPEGAYKGKTMIIETPKATVENNGVFDEIILHNMESGQWNENAAGNTIYTNSSVSGILIGENASTTLHITGVQSDVNLDVRGDVNIMAEAAANLSIKGAKGRTPKITINASDVVINTDLALDIEAHKKAAIQLNTKEAEGTRVTVDSASLIPTVEGGSITAIVDGQERKVTDPKTVPTPAPTIPTPTEEPTPTPTPETVTAAFGTPYIDGEIDEVWDKAEVFIPTKYPTQQLMPTEASGKFRTMWDGNALYVLAEVLDPNLDKANSASHEQDSVEIFLDELYDKASSYQPDDIQFRINYENTKSYDKGDRTRLYSKTKLMEDGDGNIMGYIVEACIAWLDSTVPVNGTEMGFEMQINDANGGRRAGTMNVFDSTGEAWKRPDLFGRLVLSGKEEGAVNGTNPYRLINYIEEVESMDLTIYVNPEVINDALNDAKAVAANIASTQEEINNAFNALRDAVNQLSDGSGFAKPGALPVSAEQPDIFTFYDGSPVTSLVEWEMRKDEIRQLYSYYMYGVMPDTSDEIITYEYIPSYTSWVYDDGKWEQRTITAQVNQRFTQIRIEKDGKSVQFRANVTLPSTVVEGEIIVTPPKYEDGYPVLIVIGNLGGTQKEYLSKNGYAVIEYDNGTIAADSSSRTGIFYTLYPYGRDWKEQSGVLMAWAWGASKIIDVLEIDAGIKGELNISPINTIVTGVSRNGKAAAVAGAYDTRIKVTMPGSSGAGGMANFRFNSAGMRFNYSYLEENEFIEVSGDNKGWLKYQTEEGKYIIEKTNEGLGNLQSSSQSHWFNDKFLEFSTVNSFPFDQQFLAALSAEEGRYYYITAEVDGGDWINSAGMYATYLAANRIYESLGYGDNIAIHLHSTGHMVTPTDVRYLVAFCNKHFYNQIDDEIDLDHIKTSLYDEPDNRNEAFEPFRNLPVVALN